jgi:soluble lytic murein transglycosylase-like protein
MGFTLRLMLLPLAAFAAALSGRARAQVYTLGDDGALLVREGGGAVEWRDPSVLVAAAPMGEAVPAGGAATAALAPAGYAAALHQSAARYGLNPVLFEALVWQESRWNNAAISPKGAVGLTQLMPATARALGVDPRDALANLDAGARYFRLLIDHFGGDTIKALAAYNAGPARVERAGGVPPIRETQDYVRIILARFNAQNAAGQTARP